MKSIFKDKFQLFIFFMLAFGVFFRLILTQNGSFIFNMDNARDLIDVREMVELHKLRLIGPTSGIEGFFDGPAWYYLLGIPYILSGGDPYSEILMLTLLWIIGGFFLFKLSRGWGKLATILVISLWISSNFVVLANQYSFNPNPVIFLMPVLIFFGHAYLKNPKIIYSIIFFGLAGLFFNFEMAYGFILPLVILSSCFSTGNKKYLLQKHFWIGVFIFFLTLVPQILFELKHDFFMTKSVLNYFVNDPNHSTSFNPYLRFQQIFQLYWVVLAGTLMNFGFLLKSYLWLFFASLAVYIKRVKNDKLVILCLNLIFVPFISHVLIPVSLRPWHLGGTMTVLILMLGFIVWIFSRRGRVFKLTTVIYVSIVVFFAFNNLELNKNIDPAKKSNDPSIFANEIAAVDYIYQRSAGKGFKVYTYLPSVIDYPYQYIIWWYGRKKYGYLPQEYAYLPNKPPYIPGKERLDSLTKPPYSGMVFLIKEPDQIGQRHLWENSFKSLELVSKTKIGPIELELRQE